MEDKTAPDGGWGYVVAASMTVILIVTITPMAAFGLVFGEFLRNLGDETTGITITMGVFNVVTSFTGPVSGGLLHKLSARTVGLIGAALFGSGAAASIFVRNLPQLVLFFGVMQGLGFGVLMPATMTAFNQYFDKKMSLVMSASQSVVAIFSISVPPLAIWSMTTFGFRGSVAGLALLSFLCIPAAATFIPVKPAKKTTSKDQEAAVPLKDLVEQDLGKPQPRKSVVSLGDRVASVTTLNTPSRACLDVSLLREPKYLNVALGLGLVLVSDFSFISIVPVLLGNVGFVPHDIASLMAVLFAMDLVSRVLLTLVSFKVTYSNRIVFLVGTALVALSRFGLSFRDDYTWKLVLLGAQGFFRCLVMTPMALVLAEEFPDRFSSAFSLSMAINGVITMGISFLMSIIKKYTGSDVLLCHLLTATNTICVVTWIVEMVVTRKSQK